MRVDDGTANLLPIHHTTPPPDDSDVRADMMRYASVAAVARGRSASSDFESNGDSYAPSDDDSEDKDY